MYRLLLLFATALLCAPSLWAQDVVINELRTDQPSADNDEYFELRGNGGTDLTGHTYIVIGDNTAGGSGVIEAIVDLSGQAIPIGGYFLGAEDTFTLNGATPDFVTTLNFENSDSVTHLLALGFTGAEGDDLDTDDDGTLDVMPWTSVVDAIGFVDDMNDLAYGAALGFTDLGPVGTFPPAHAYRAADVGEWVIGEFDIAIGDDTPGEMNVGTVANEPGADARSFRLAAPRPNPTAGIASLAFTLDAPANIRLAVYDVLGREVAVLADGRYGAARHTATLSASALPVGTYIVRLAAEAQAVTQRLVVVR